MEKELFIQIRERFCLRDPEIEKGKMMSSDAITYKGKVFAFFSRKNKMVFKLGKEFDCKDYGIEMAVFNPFKKRGPLKGWFEVSFSEKEQWDALTEKALELVKAEKEL